MGLRIGRGDRVGARPMSKATAQEILAVMNAAGSHRALLIGSSDGGPGCIRFAVDHPIAWSASFCGNSLAKGSRAPDYPFA